MPLPVLGKGRASQSLNKGDSSRKGLEEVYQQIVGRGSPLVLRSGNNGDFESHNVPRKAVIDADEDHAGTALLVDLLDYLVETGNGPSTYGQTNPLEVKAESALSTCFGEPHSIRIADELRFRQKSSSSAGSKEYL